MEEEPVSEHRVFQQLRRRNKIIRAEVLSAPPDSEKRYIVVDRKTGEEVKRLTVRERQRIEIALWGTASPEVVRGLEQQAFIAKRKTERKSRKPKGR